MSSMVCFQCRQLHVIIVARALKSYRVQPTSLSIAISVMAIIHVFGWHWANIILFRKYFRWCGEEHGTSRRADLKAPSRNDYGSHRAGEHSCESDAWSVNPMIKSGYF